jgi:DNA mismatch repair protein MutL
MGKKISIEDYKELFQPRVSGTLQDFKPLTLPLKEGEMEKGGDRFIPDKLFQLHDRYIIAQIKSGLVILDQHAAHERVLFEHSLSALTSGKISRQKLLFPRFLELTYGEDEIFEQMLPWLEKIGFDLVPVGPRLYQVETVPAGMKITDEIALLQEMLEYYSENDDRSIEPAERVCSAFACKAAIKAGEVLTPVEAVELIEALFRTGISHACPHGRPTYITLELRELEKRFGRS